MSRLAVVVEFRLKPDALARFDAVIREHARLTLAEEPGCERFDVLRPLGQDGAPDPSRVMLVEVYRDAAAFEAHNRNPRLPGVREAYSGLVEARTLTLCAL
jgi:quinol monooxygenase YgiN